ncbi:hypothetical protein CVT26_000518 [Gymnopilus dilepis]|uniref:Uncharacterized protein n=1 Tax=Gymnopilus dilepis TaxID=231916 RepID=A0A409VH39_9AGAR|nr:hypothetical protein CVT26_000518 [Gymnopilus dilepis]
MALLFLLLLFLPFVSAVPALAAARTSSAPSLSNAVPHNTPAPKKASTHPPITHPHLPTTTHRSVQIISRPTLPTNAVVPIPVHTHRPPPPPLPPPQSNQKPISIAFEVLGGLFGSLILVGLVRCCYNYRKTPSRDRIADILQRHNLQRELEELERNPAVLRRPSLREPAPPYFPRPPSYEDFNPPQPVRSNPGPAYSAVATSSPPPSPPPMSQRDLPGAPVTVRPHPDLIPQIPSG